MSGNNENLWSSSLTGSVLGLNVVLNIEQLHYLTAGLTPSAGARVTIHDTMVRPLVDEFGLDVEPHKATNFAIEKTSYVRQPSPWDTECFSSWADTNYSSYTGDKDWPYTAMVCTTHKSVPDSVCLAMQEVLSV